MPVFLEEIRKLAEKISVNKDKMRQKEPSPCLLDK